MKIVNKQYRNQQQGIVSIVVVVIFIVILSLMSIGFTKIMNRELRQSIDRELASQANYAAESGLNDARSYLSQAINAGNPNSADTNGNCINLNSPPVGSQFVKNGNVSGHYIDPSNPTNDLVKYTCVIIETQPKSLSYPINAGESKVFKIAAAGTVDNIMFGWQNSDAADDLDSHPLPGANAAHDLPQEIAFTSPKHTGMLRVSIYPLNSGNNGGTIATNAKTYFLYSNASSANNPGTGAFTNNTAIINGNCNNENKGDPNYNRYCNSRITGVPNFNYYYVRVTALYKNLNVAVRALNGNTSLELAGAQAVIDVTGQGNDVLKRIQARVPITTPSEYEVFTTQSMDTLCKRIRLPKIGLNSYDPAVVEDTPAAASVDNVCKPSI